MALSLLLASLGTARAADPVAQRAVAPAAAVVGRETASVAVTLAPGGPALGALVRTDGGAVGAFVGLRRTWARDPARGPLAAVGASASLLALPVAGGVGAGLAPWASVGTRGRAGGAAASLAAPLAAGTGQGGGVRLPATAGLEAFVRLRGPVTLGALLTAGAAFTPGLDVSVIGDAAVTLGWSPARAPGGDREPGARGR